MGWLKALFPGPAAASGALSTVVKGIDELYYSKQEKAEDKQAAKKQAADLYIQWMQATSGQNRARRAIALTVTAIWAFMLMSGFLVDLAAVWVPEAYYDRLMASSKAIAERAGTIHTPFMIILGFYFGQRMLDAFKKGDKP